MPTRRSMTLMLIRTPRSSSPENEAPAGNITLPEALSSFRLFDKWGRLPFGYADRLVLFLDSSKEGTSPA